MALSLNVHFKHRFGTVYGWPIVEFRHVKKSEAFRKHVGQQERFVLQHLARILEGDDTYASTAQAANEIREAFRDHDTEYRTSLKAHVGNQRGSLETGESPPGSPARTMFKITVDGSKTSLFRIQAVTFKSLA